MIFICIYICTYIIYLYMIHFLKTSILTCCFCESFCFLKNPSSYLSLIHIHIHMHICMHIYLYMCLYTSRYHFWKMVYVSLKPIGLPMPDGNRLATNRCHQLPGKFRCLTRQMPLDQQRPEQALLYILMSFGHCLKPENYPP